MKFHFTQIFFIIFYQFINASNNTRVEEIAIQSKAISDTFIKRWKFSSETVCGNLIIIIEVLQNSDDFLYCLNVRIGNFLIIKTRVVVNMIRVVRPY